MLTVSNISKSFPGIQALSDVTMSVVAGEIHALVGENGAGKSTLVKVIGGAITPDSGNLALAGTTVRWSAPADAKAAGIEIVYQEFLIFPHLSIAENVFIDREPCKRAGTIDYARMRRETREILLRLGLDLDPARSARDLSIADQQIVEIAKALVHDVKLLILDEPTAVISGREVDLLFSRLRALRHEGVAILYISHRLDEIFTLCDRVTVLKDGKLVGTFPVAGMTRQSLIARMVGRELSNLFPSKPPPQNNTQLVLATESLTVHGSLRDVTIRLRAGQITGLAGMVGSGRSELAMAIFGALPLDAGSVWNNGKTYQRLSPAQAIAEGIGFVTEDRKGLGLAMLLDISANISAPDLGTFSRYGIIDRAREDQIAGEEIAAYQIACRGPRTPVQQMSGGNQQKVLIARWARLCRMALILDEPTRGVDVGAKAEIYRIIRAIAANGTAVLVISSELQEIIGLCDLTYVMRGGEISGMLLGEITEEAILKLAVSSGAE
jgi:ribose transport system ATP-binding protein